MIRSSTGSVSPRSVRWPRGVPDGGPAAPRQSEEPARSMKPYVETIPGTPVSFEMLPIQAARLRWAA